MNRDKLGKMKLILQSDRSLWDDLPAFQQKMKETPTPASFTPNYSVDSAPGMVSTTFGNESMFQTSNEPRSASESQPPRLASPAHFHSPHPYPVTTQSPPPSFDTNMFDTGHGSMFDSPSHEMKPSVTSPGDFGGTSQSMFESPKVGMGSPGFDATPQYPTNIDHVFADLVNDHDTIGGFDGTNDVREKDESAEEAAAAAALPTTETALQTGEHSQDVDMPDAGGPDVADQEALGAPENDNAAAGAGDANNDEAAAQFNG
jgi:hypothetical protein